MPRPEVNLDHLRPEIEQRIILRKQSHKEVLAWLATQGIVINRKTLQRRIIQWGISRHGPAAHETAVASVENAFRYTTKDDTAIARDLNAQGIQSTARQVQNLRLGKGWLHKAANGDEEQKSEQRTATFDIVQQELQEGTVRSYGRELVQTHLRIHHGHRSREDDVRDALHELDEKGTAARKPGPKKRRKRGGEFIVRGPDWLWCIDGHDKFRNYGIGIYAAVDAFSRRILWFYLGNSNRRAVSILRQMTAAVRSHGRCPRFWRSDHGNEVLLLADAHFSFYREYKRSQGFSDDAVNSLRVRQCYMFGSSTSNVKIESVWMRMIGSQTAVWIVRIFFLPQILPLIFSRPTFASSSLTASTRVTF
jgi:hypothetical protein